MTGPYVFGLSAVVISALMVGTWFVARRINNYSFVDPVWAVGFVIVAWIYAALGTGWAPRRAGVAIMLTLWGVRLARFLFKRILGHHPQEDGRYQELRRGYEPHVARGFFWFFQIQAASVVLLSVPLLLIAQNEEPQWAVIEIVGLGLWVVSFAGEALADRQMHRFKQNPSNRGKTCTVGLWGYSRHPNYFFESLLWWAYYLIALNASDGVYGIYAPAFMLYILTCVTGVPPSEAQALRSRGDEFREYQKRVSVFVPWFPKRGAP